MGRFLFGRTPSTAGFTFPNNRTQNFTIFCYRTRLYFLATRWANTATKTLASRVVWLGSSIALTRMPVRQNNSLKKTKDI